MEKKEEYFSNIQGGFDVKTATDLELISNLVEIKMDCIFFLCGFHLKDTICKCFHCMKDVHSEDIKSFCFDCSGVDYYKIYQEQINIREKTEGFIKCKDTLGEYFKCMFDAKYPCPNSCNRICFNCNRCIENALPYCLSCSGIKILTLLFFYTKCFIYIQGLIRLIEKVQS